MDKILNTKNLLHKKIAVMGGTFDPIHIAHLAAAQSVLVKFNMDKVIFIPTGNPPHKINSKITHADHRFNMVFLAIENNINFEVSDIEIKREGLTYTMDTFLELKKIFGEETQIHFIVGADAIFNIKAWHNYEELLKIANFIVVERAGYDSVKLKESVDKLNEQFACDIVLTKIPNLKISSSLIRDMIKNDEPIKYLVRDEVEAYITANYLYKN